MRRALWLHKRQGKQVQEGFWEGAALALMTWGVYKVEGGVGGDSRPGRAGSGAGLNGA